MNAVSLKKLMEKAFAVVYAQMKYLKNDQVRPQFGKNFISAPLDLNKFGISARALIRRFT